MLIPKIVLVFDRRHTADRSHKGGIDLRVTLGKRQKFMSTGISVYPTQWKGGNPYVSGYESSATDNACLAAIVKKASKIISDMVDRDEVDLDAIPRLMKQSGSDTTFLAYIRQRMDAKNVVEYTKASYVSFYNKLSEYGRIKFFSDITEKSVRDFDEWLHKYEWTERDMYGKTVKRRYSQATIGSFHKNLKSFIADAVIDGYVRDNVYVSKGIKIDKGRTRIEQYLTPEEIERIESADMPTKGLSEARDLFLIQVYTGLAYIDLMAFDFSKQDMEGGEVIYHGTRHKTGVEFTFVLLPKAKEILERYGYRLPKMPNQKYNIRLKLVAEAAGIDKPITSHDGRRSCGYTLLNAGVPIEIVSRVLGHESIRMTEQSYAKVLSKTIVEAFKKVTS